MLASFGSDSLSGRELVLSFHSSQFQPFERVVRKEETPLLRTADTPLGGRRRPTACTRSSLRRRAPSD